MKVAASIQSTNTKAAARVKDITTKAATTNTMQVAAKVKNIAMKAATKNITRADLDATFSLSELAFEGGMYVEDTKKLVLPEVPGFGFIGFKDEQ